MKVGTPAIRTKPAEHKGSLRILDILDILSELSRPVALSELAQQAGLPKSTVHRLLTILKDAGYVQQDAETERYQLGIRAMRLGVAALRSHSLLQIAHPYMERLAEQTEETVQLAVRDGNRVLALHRVESDRHMIRAALPSGVRTPLHATAAGKILLAGLPDGEREALIEQLELRRLTPMTITARSALRREIDDVREKGYSVDNGENNPDVRCVGVPIRDLSGAVVASLSITAPASRLSLENAPQLAALAQATAHEISARLSLSKQSRTLS